MKRSNACALVGWNLLALAVACAGCDCGAQKPFVLATLTAIDGTGVQRDSAASVGQWQSAQVGAHFSVGDGVKTLAPSQATLELTGGGELRVRPGSIIRFVVDGAQAGERALDVQTGEALLISGMAELRLRTHVGLAVISPGTRVVLGRSGDALNYDVEVGEARFRNARGEEVVLSAGENLDVEIGMATLKRKAAVVDAGSDVHAEIGDAVIARVESDGVTVRASAAGTWQPLDVGERSLPRGAQLKLPAGAVVELARGADKARLTGSGEFVVGSGAVLVETKHGGVHVDATAADVQIVVPGGLIVARAEAGGSRGHVQVGATSGSITVERGSVTFTGKEGTVELASGAEHEFAIQGAQAVEEDARFAPGPDYSNVSVRAGQSFVVHAPDVPVAIAFDVSHKCKGEVALELGGAIAGAKRQRGQGMGSANLLFPAGTRGYTARCVDDKRGPGPIVARGSVQVLNDPGTRKLPPRPPTSEVEADGRTYSVYYQNQLPDIRVRWPNAPADPKYTLEVDGKVLALGKPEHVFRSGSLRDGVHRLAFAAGSRRSRTTTVEVSFDNTAPTASLSAPVDRSFSPGETVSIEGVVLPTWKVSVDGGTITMEGAERFVGQVATSAAKPDVAVRLTHPRLGTHYYLRRAAGSR